MESADEGGSYSQVRHKKRKEGGLRGLSSFKCRASKTERVREQERKHGGNSEIQGLSYSPDIS